MSELKSNWFKCKECGGVFEEEWSEERALAEYRKMFGKLPKAILEDKEPLCDGCYQKILMKISH